MLHDTSLPVYFHISGPTLPGEWIVLVHGTIEHGMARGLLNIA